MDKKHCADCYYNSFCGYGEACEDYYPVEDNAVDSTIDSVIEEGRFSFRAEWFKYIEAFDR